MRRTDDKITLPIKAPATLTAVLRAAAAASALAAALATISIFGGCATTRHLFAPKSAEATLAPTRGNSAAGLMGTALSGCTLAEVKVNVASERTSLENQILGSYNSLSEETLLVASVRGVDPLGRIQTPQKKSGEQQDAVTAMQVLSFHADDVDAFKRLGWVGEDNKGLLTAFAMQLTMPVRDVPLIPVCCLNSMAWPIVAIPMVF